MKKEILAVVFELNSKDSYSVLNLGGEFIFDFKSKVDNDVVLSVAKNDLYIKDYFGENISNITALVGKNGKGKTSLLIDILKSSTDKDRFYILKEGEEFYVSYMISYKEYMYLPLGKFDDLIHKITINKDNFKNKNHYYFIFNQGNIQDKEVFYYTPLSNYSTHYNELDFTSFYNDKKFTDYGIYLDLKSIELGKRFRQIELIKNTALLEKLKEVYSDFPKYDSFRFISKDYLLQYELGENVDRIFKTTSNYINFKRLWSYCSSLQDDDQFNYVVNNTFIASLLFRVSLLVMQIVKIDANRILELYHHFHIIRHEEGDNGSSFQDIIKELINRSTDKNLTELLKRISALIDKFHSMAVNSYEKFDIMEINEFTEEYNNILREVQGMFKSIRTKKDELSKINNYLSGDFLLFDTDLKLSFGQENMLNIFADIYSQRDVVLKNKFCFLLLDEVELGYHPEWKQKLISCLVKVLPIILPKTNIQILLTSHDPFLLSDLPTKSVVLLEDFKTFSKSPKTLGSNILELFANNFYLKDSLIGEYSKEVLEKTIAWLNNEEITEKATLNDKEFYKQVINNIGEPILRNSLNEMWEDKFLTQKQRIENQVQQLEQQIRYLKSLPQN